MNKATVCGSTQLMQHQTARITVITVYITVISSHRLSERLESRSIIRTPHPLKPLNTIALGWSEGFQGGRLLGPHDSDTSDGAVVSPWHIPEGQTYSKYCTMVQDKQSKHFSCKKDFFFFFWLRFLHKKKTSLAEIVAKNSCF